jgi:prepilin-type N-terminal cleavage/methylation domain-containing protein
MNYRSKNILLAQRRCKAFTLIEVVAAATIIGIIISSVLVVFIRCSSAVRDSARQMQALDVARENMETLLGAETLPEQVVYGYSDKYPAIQWTNRVETFYEPVAEKMWLRAVCSAQYEDSNGEIKTVEFTHWLTKLNEKQVQQLREARETLENLADLLGLSSPEELLSAPSSPGRDSGFEGPDNLPQLPEDLSQMTPEELIKWIEENQK